MKSLIGLAAITGVVVFAYVRSLGVKVDRTKVLTEGNKPNTQLV
jgi:hypothetical protein